VGDILVCPKCQERLWVGDIQIPLVTCPKCLARVVNPNAAEEPMARRSVPRTRQARQVIPVEEEAGWDVWETSRGLIIFGVLLFVGAVILTQVAWWGELVLFLAVIVDFGIVVLCFWNAPQIHQRPRYSRPDRFESGDVLDYANISNVRDFSGRAYRHGFAFGIGAMVLLCFAIEAYRTGPHALVMGIVAGTAFAALIYFTIRAARDPEQKGFASGAGTGLLLGGGACLPCALYM